MRLSSPVAERLARLAADQRAAATAPPGPVLCVAPAGSGKTTTLVARIAWLVDLGIDPETITAVTFNRRAAVELAGRLETALPPEAVRIRVRTFHALGLEILRDAGATVSPLMDRESVLRAIAPAASPGERRRLDTTFSRLKLDLAVDPAAVAADLEAGPVARAFVAYEAALATAGGLDFDDLVARSVSRLEADPDLLARWRARCAHLLVDEAQDLDRMQLRMALILAAPANRIFLVGDDDQSIYGWRLADVRRLLGLAETSLPGLRRVDLVTNYRCPGVVIDRAVRLVEHNRERFAKEIRARPAAIGTLILAPSRTDAVDSCGAVLGSWPADDGTQAILARTNRELLPAVAACLDLDVPFHAGDLALPVESPLVDGIVDAAAETEVALGLLGSLAAQHARAATERWEEDNSDPAPPDALADDVSRVPGTAIPGHDAATAFEAAEIAAAVLAWAPRYASIAGLRDAIASVRARLARLRSDDARLTLATAHGTKGLEFDHVAVIGLDDGRFPSARSVAEAEDPARALEEERRLAYVAWTRARRTLTLVYDPDAPSPFLLEAFEPEEIWSTG
jgi:superfamily I DNA/RNA helicase